MMNLQSNEVLLAASFDALLYLVIGAIFGIGKLIEFINTKKMQADNKTNRKKIKRTPAPPTPFNENQNETAEEFFTRLEAQKKKKKKPRVRLSKQLDPEPVFQEPEPIFQERHVIMPSQLADNIELSNSLPPTKTSKKKVASTNKINNIIDRQDLKSIRKAIIINEVLGQPQAFKH